MMLFGKRQPAGEPPRPPCAAYAEVANMLPESYFTQHPPQSGLILDAIHSDDGLTSTWYLSPALARLTADALSKIKGLSVRLDPYDGQMTLEAG